jgi:two-component system sensor histidine kinase KdpD
MQDVERIPTLEGETTFHWSRFFLESVFAIGSALAVTGLIALLHLYPQIPNISVVYLLVILLLASTFGRYAAVLASVVAFLAFDYFLVPPVYTFTIARQEDWIALFISLVTALLTSQLASVTVLARRHEREARILYELLRFANTHELLDELLNMIVFSTVHIFASWGVRAGAVLLPDTQGNLQILADSLHSDERFALSDDELALATSTMTDGRVQEKRYAPPPDEHDSEHKIMHYNTIGLVSILRFIPLQKEQHVSGVLCLSIQRPVPWFANVARMEEDRARPTSRGAFFWIYREQVSTLIERALLRSAVHIRHE